MTITAIAAVVAVLIGLCLWRHYRGLDRGKYSKQGEEGDNRNGSMLREIATSPRQFHSGAGSYYEALPSTYLEDNPQSMVLEEFRTQLDLLWANDCALLTSEYTSLGQSELRYPTEAAREHITDGKNRYKNIYPYPLAGTSGAESGLLSDYPQRLLTFRDEVLVPGNLFVIRPGTEEGDNVGVLGHGGRRYPNA